jgi:hypothetical protein
MKRNINPVITEQLEPSKEISCLPPEVVLRRPGRPITKRLRIGRSKYSNPGESSIICGICKGRGHNKRTCLARNKATTSTTITKTTPPPVVDEFATAFEHIELPVADHT